MHPLKIFSFEVEINASDISDELVDLVFDAQCDDAILCKTDSIVYLSFEREARNRDLAVRAAVRALQSVGVPLIVNEELSA